MLSAHMLGEIESQMSKNRARLDRRLGKRIYFCGFKECYCEHTVKDQRTVCTTCPIEEEKFEEARKTIRDHAEKSKETQF